MFHQFQIPLTVPRLVSSKGATARVFFNRLAQRIQLRVIQAVKFSLRQHDPLHVLPTFAFYHRKGCAPNATNGRRSIVNFGPACHKNRVACYAI
jgi:hypothetical protein